MTKITTVGLDLAKLVFQVHGADQDGRPVVRKKLRRGQVLGFFAELSPCLIGLEACASAHYWARELQALGHEVRLIPPQYVKPFVKTNKNDASDAEAICEALIRPTMRFAPIKSAEQQSVLMLHRARELLVRQKTMLINALRGHCGELGIVVAQGASRVAELIAIIEDQEDDRIPALACEALGYLVGQLRMVQAQVLGLEKKLKTWHRANEASRRLETILRCRGDHGYGPCRDDRRCIAVPLRPSTGGLAWTGSATALQRRQGTARANIEARRRVSEKTAGSRRANRPAVVQAQKGNAFAMARSPACAPAHQCCAGGNGQQDGPCCVGASQPGRSIPDRPSTGCMTQGGANYIARVMMM